MPDNKEAHVRMTDLHDIVIALQSDGFHDEADAINRIIDAMGTPDATVGNVLDVIEAKPSGYTIEGDDSKYGIGEPDELAEHAVDEWAEPGKVYGLVPWVSRPMEWYAVVPHIERGEFVDDTYAGDYEVVGPYATDCIARHEAEKITAARLVTLKQKAGEKGGDDA
jgi:hypothetical protein